MILEYCLAAILIAGCTLLWLSDALLVVRRGRG